MITLNTEFIKLDNSENDDIVLKRAGEIIYNGGLVAFPTETVYGLGGSAYDKEASKKIFAAKGRPSDNPLIVHIAKPEDAEEFAVTNDMYYRIAKEFMPGPLTVILPKKEKIPASVTGGLDTVAVRCPDNIFARKLIEFAKVPIAAPSANLSGLPSPTNASHVFRDMNGRIEMILDGGECRIGVESTVISLNENGCTVLRPGEIIPRELSAVVGNVFVSKAVTNPNEAGDKPLSPGMKYKHYAPTSPLYLLDGDSLSFREYVNSYKGNCAVLSYTENLNDYTCFKIYNIGKEKNAKEQMHNLFKILRDTDSLELDAIFAHLPPKNDDFLALYNRIIRAAGCEIIKL